MWQESNNKPKSKAATSAQLIMLPKSRTIRSLPTLCQRMYSPFPPSFWPQYSIIIVKLWQDVLLKKENSYNDDINNISKVHFLLNNSFRPFSLSINPSRIVAQACLVIAAPTAPVCKNAQASNSKRRQKRSRQVPRDHQKSSLAGH